MIYLYRVSDLRQVGILYSYFRDLRDATYMYNHQEALHVGDYRCIPKVSKQLRYLPDVIN